MCNRILRVIALLALTAFVSGCFTTGKNKTPRSEYNPEYRPMNVAGKGSIPSGLRRVVVLPVFWAEDPDSDFLRYLDSTIILSLQRTGAFELVPLDRAEMRKLFGKTQYSSVGVLPDNLVEELKRVYAADGALFVDLTVNRPYRPMALGFRTRILDFNGMDVVWSADILFDGADPAVALAARDFAEKTTFNPSPVDKSGAILQSPRSFAVFATDVLFSSLPIRK